MISVDLNRYRPKGMSDEEWAELLFRVLSRVQDATPVRTGQLRDGWRMQDGELVNDVPYAAFVNDGTSRMSARDMVQQGLSLLKGR